MALGSLLLAVAATLQTPMVGGRHGELVMMASKHL